MSISLMVGIVAFCHHNYRCHTQHICIVTHWHTICIHCGVYCRIIVVTHRTFALRDTHHLHSSGVLSICIALYLYCLSIQHNVRQILTSAEGTSRAFELWTTMLIKDLWKTFHSSAISYKCSMTKFTPSVRYFVHQFPRHDNDNVNWAI